MTGLSFSCTNTLSFLFPFYELNSEIPARLSETPAAHFDMTHGTPLSLATAHLETTVLKL